MRKILAVLIFSAFFLPEAYTQEPARLFDSVLFNRNLQLATQLVDYEYILQIATDKLQQEQDISDMDCFCLLQQNIWHVIAGNCTNLAYSVKKHIIFDTSGNITNYNGNSDTSVYAPGGCALSHAKKEFQVVTDTALLYFNAFVVNNSDKTLSIWFLPAVQPSGQAVYGCEWEYIYNDTGTKLLRSNSYASNTTGIWIGQPRELWLNYRNTDTPTVGSLFFALSFRDYFTRLRIDTRKSTSTTVKDNNGNYTWTHKMK